MCEYFTPLGEQKSIHSTNAQKPRQLKHIYFFVLFLSLDIFSMDATRNLGCILIIISALQG